MTMLMTDRLLLRPATAQDLAPMHAILSDPEAMAFWSTPPHTLVSQTEEWLQTTIDIPTSAGDDFVVECDGAVIGKAGLWRFPEIGFIFDRAVWGRGYAAEALAAVVSRGFKEHRLPAIEADVDPRNTACLKLLTRLGFRETGKAERTWLVDGVWCDSAYFALSPAEWDARRV